MCAGVHFVVLSLARLTFIGLISIYFQKMHNVSLTNDASSQINTAIRYNDVTWQIDWNSYGQPFSEDGPSSLSIIPQGAGIDSERESF